MVNFASLIHKKYKKGCLDVLTSAIKLNMPFVDMIYILYCFNKAFKSPFLDIIEYADKIKKTKFGEIMEELLVARDIVLNSMNKEIAKLETKIIEWNQDIINDQKLDFN